MQRLLGLRDRPRDGLLQAPVGGHLEDDVAPPHQLALDVELRVRRPVAVLLQTLPHLLVLQNVKRLTNGLEIRSIEFVFVLIECSSRLVHDLVGHVSQFNLGLATLIFLRKGFSLSNLCLDFIF